jgi:putative FmdB family regulatory protein
MPTYQYRCGACGHEFEAFQSITEKPIARCPECKKPRVKRLIGTGAGLLFKGGGFYLTDYRSEGYRQKAKEETKAADSASGGQAPDKGDAAAKTSGGSGDAAKKTRKEPSKSKDSAQKSKGA